jgi:hypothetical protein
MVQTKCCIQGLRSKGLADLFDNYDNVSDSDTPSANMDGVSTHDENTEG